MGCIVSSAHLPAAPEADGRAASIMPPLPNHERRVAKNRRLTLSARTARSSAGSYSDGRNSATGSSFMKGRRESTSSQRRSSSGAFHFFGALGSRESSRASAAEAEGRRGSAALDPLGLGKESDVSAPPSQWLIVMGPRSSGKSTLIRQVKLAHDGFDEVEALRCLRAVHTQALASFKAVLRDVKYEKASDEIGHLIDKVMLLKRRVLITADIAADLSALWQRPEVLKAEDESADVQSRSACRHFIGRLDALCADGYVPDASDLMHLAIPTSGTQETRVPTFPNGGLNLVEINADLRASIFQPNRRKEHHQELFGPGLRGIICVASALDLDVPGAPPRRGSTDAVTFSPPAAHRATAETSRPDGPLALRREALDYQLEAQAQAAAAGVPCFTLLSKTDLLAEAKTLRGGMSAAEAESALLSQLAANGSANAPAADSTPTPSPDRSSMRARQSASDSCAAQPTPPAIPPLSISLVDSDHSVPSFLEYMMRTAFPDEDGDVPGLEEAVYVCLAAFCSSEGTMISKHGAIPVAKMQTGVLTLEEHTWLQELPQPVPNPRLATPEVAARLGKDSHIKSQSQFWAAIVALAERLGGYEPPHLGVLHPAPLLTVSGALLLVFRQDHVSPPSLGPSSRRSATWRTVAQVAGKMAKVAQAAELISYRRENSQVSYTADVREMQATHATKELMPSVWLGRLRLACEAPSVTGLAPGTYMVSMMTHSSFEGFRVLLPENEPPSMPPFVKISNSPISAADWATISELAVAVEAGRLPNVPDNWGAAAAWMGPEVGSESQFSALQKFYYGVNCLRQRLERRCTAMHDELRYSKQAAAGDALSSIGTLYRDIVTADPLGRVQFIVLFEHFSVAGVDSFPPTLRWRPFRLFEAAHYWRFAPIAFEELCRGKQLLVTGAGVRCGLESTIGLSSSGLHGSGMRGSGMRGSGLSSASAGLRGSNMPSYMRHSGEPQMHLVKVHPGGDPAAKPVRRSFDLSFDAIHEQERLEGAWDPLRWTKRLVQRTLSQGTTVTNPTTKLPQRISLLGSISNKPLSPQQRVLQHKKTYQASMDALRRCTSELKGRVEKLSISAAEFSEAVIDESAAAAVKSMGQLKGGPPPAARKLSFTA